MTPKLSLTTPSTNRSGRRIAAVYARYSTDKQDSAEDQIRECKAWAEDIGYHVPDDLIFVDRALTGRSKKNPAFQALGEAARAKKMDAAIFLSTSRLGRSLRKTLGMAEDIFRPNGVRGVFLAENIDMQDADRWQMLLSLHGLMDQMQATCGNASIRASHKGQLKNREVFGNTPYGYTGKVIPGKFTKRGTPSHTIIIDKEHAEMVRQIFHWFVDDGMTVPALCRYLNSQGITPPSGCSTRRWNYDVIKRMLRNPRYIGRWSYGELENMWISEEDRSKQKRRDEPLATESFEVLRIIDQRLWECAQQTILDCPNRPRSPRRRKGETTAPLTPILRGFLVCGYHPDIRLSVNGSRKSLCCMVCQTTEKKLFTHLSRPEATTMVLGEIARRLTEDESLLTAAARTCRHLMENMDTKIPQQIHQHEKLVEALTRKIKLQSQVASYSEEDERENLQLQDELRRRRARLRVDIEDMKRIQDQQQAIPDESAIREAFCHFTDVLEQASESKDELLRSRVRELLSKVIGGKIEVFQAGPRVKNKGWCRLEFTLNPLAFWDGLQETCNVPVETISIEMDPPRPPYMKMADQVKDLFDKGLNLKQIGKKLGYGETFISRSLKYWFTSRGLTPPTGSDLLKRLKRPPRLAEQIADEVMAMVQRDIPLGDIAKRFNTSRNTITRAIKIWYEKRGLPVPDGRALRKARNQRRREAKKQSPTPSQPASGAPTDSFQKKVVMTETSVDHVVADDRKVG